MRCETAFFLLGYTRSDSRGTRRKTTITTEFCRVLYAFSVLDRHETA